MIVIGLMGRIGSGKGTVADILIKDYGFKSIAIGDLAREETISRGLEPTREETTKVSTELLSRDPAYFIKKAVNIIKNSGHDRWIIDGIRTPLNVTEFMKAFPGIKFVRVDVKPEIRFERMKLRGRVGFPKTFDKFLEHERLEDERFELTKALSNADYVLINDGSMADLAKQTRELAKSILGE